MATAVPTKPTKPMTPKAAMARKRPVKPAAARKPTAKATKPAAHGVTAHVRFDDMAVQADLATMDARDQWNRLMKQVERRRAAVETAMRRLAAGGADATRTLNEAVRDAMVELRDAVEAAIAALR